MSSVRSVAKELVRLSQDAAEPLTQARLQRLLCCTQAWSVLLRDGALFPEDIDCTVSLPDDPLEGFDSEPSLDAQDEAEFLRCIWSDYGSSASLPPTGSVSLDPLPPALSEYWRVRQQQVMEAERFLRERGPLDIEAIWGNCRSRTPNATRP